MRPEYNDKIIEANLLAPVAFMNGTEGFLTKIMARFYVPLKNVLNIFRIYKFTVNNQFLSQAVEVACKHITRKLGLCKMFLSFLRSHQLNYASVSRELEFIIDLIPSLLCFTIVVVFPDRESR